MDIRSIKTQQESDDIANPRSLCLICKKSTTKYICPKCSLPYCSLDCYKKHSSNCTESFYRENVVDVMKGQRATAQEQQQMAKILRRVHQEDAPTEDQLNESDESDEEKELEMLASLNLDDPAIISKLSKSQLKEFHKFIAEGKMSVDFDIWEPWWQSPTHSGKIQVLDEEDKSVADSRLPPIKSDIPTLSSLIKVSPSPLVMFSLLDVLYSYCFSMRLYNGDWRPDVEGAVGVILTLSDILSKNTVYQSAAQAVSRSLELSMQPHVKNTLPFSISILDDVLDVLKTKTGRLAALCELEGFLSAFIDTGRELTSPKSKAQKQATIAVKKLQFLLSWTNETPDEVFQALRLELSHETSTRREMLRQEYS